MIPPQDGHDNGGRSRSYSGSQFQNRDHSRVSNSSDRQGMNNRQQVNNVMNDDSSDRGAGHSTRIDSFSQDNYDAYQEGEDGYSENQNNQGSKKPWGCQAVNDSNIGSISAEYVGDWAEWSEQQFWEDKYYVGEWKVKQVRTELRKEEKYEKIEKEKKKENKSPAPTTSVGLFVGQADTTYGLAIKGANRMFGYEHNSLAMKMSYKPVESAMRNEQPLQ